MDGIAVRSSATFAAREGSPVTLQKGAGFVPVNTGHPLPDGMDSVVMIEQVEQVDEDTVRIEASFPGSTCGASARHRATELLLPQNHTLSAYDVGALLAAGIFELKVWERVRLTFIPTGDEVLDFLEAPTPGPGQVIESNSQVFRAIVGPGARPSWVARAGQPQALQAASPGWRRHVVVGGNPPGEQGLTQRSAEGLWRILCRANLGDDEQLGAG
jgi:putative molybdopterin biosynthesis protein